MVPQSVFNELGNPSMLSLLSRPDNSTIGAILILEDADEALRKRDGSHSSAPVASLLNLTDGLLGRSHDIRIVATTNLDTDDIDPAVRRPGRMIDHVVVPSLTSRDAMAVYESATRALNGGRLPPPDPGDFSWEGVTLAEVYEVVRRQQKTRTGVPEARV